ncbi:MAG: hypothetical protein NZL92_04900 [Gloeomargarita sp. SKYG116]|nr:hypothetical protein [Gloeomargarita sp. SKYG116]MCS7293351.1 hypothetical protein [Gloeomargarita sp. SKYB120]MDW8178916.1 hypothetical protein [Gloeomargarita sp. SKYBB_i_bin120]MDW8401013.1 hypothetical protein [Gloeomargarita sp. SKYGB_i_bin116]
MARSRRVHALRLQQGLLIWLLSRYYRAKKDGGFVLPTATLLIIVAFLIMIGLVARTANRVVQVAGQRERVVIEGPTSESIDRARAKLEYLFTRESRLSREQREQEIEDLLGHRRRDNTGRVVGAAAVNDVYTLPDEVRCASQDGRCFDAPATYTPDNIAPTWAYRVDLNGNGRTTDPQDGVAVYSIIGRVTRAGRSAVPREGYTLLPDRRQRAANFVVNNAPVQAEQGDAFCQGAAGAGGGFNEDTGRFTSASSADEYKNFQVYAVTIPNRIGQDPQLTLNAAVFQQDRTYIGAGKWGAWFRYDIEIQRPPQFNWNGAMHTEGSLILYSPFAPLTSYLVSAPNSCYYVPPFNSLISTRGLLMSGTTDTNTDDPGPSVFIHLHPGGRQAPTQIIRLSRGAGHPNPPGPGQFDNDDAVRSGFLPADIAIDPLHLVLTGIPLPRRRPAGTETYDTYVDSNFFGGALSRRVRVGRCEVPPYVDDTYRADNRLGPKPSYERGSCDGIQPWTGRAGDPITDPKLISNIAPPDKPEDYGLDGYWERRALGQGMKVIVGQRLELGNVGVWGSWRTYGTVSGTWNHWQSWSATPDRRGQLIDSNVPTTNPYFNAGTNPESREIYGLLFRPDTIIRAGSQTIPAPGAADPLYPPLLLGSVIASTSEYEWGTMPALQFGSRLNWQLHRRTQRDNLAAVQATAVYYYRAQDRSLPLLCLSSTIHPGTEASYLNSITYGDPVSPADPNSAQGLTRYPRLNANFVRPVGTQALFPPADFFTGRGTANMEYGDALNPLDPPFDEEDFDRGTALMKALTNLAYFAGDPNGAYPPLQRPQGSTQVHPDPVLTMWGNFSNLRRTIGMLGSTSYDQLPPADQANLHTAGCTLGILADNVYWYLDWGYRGRGRDFYMSGNPDQPYQNEPPTPNVPPNPPNQASPGDRGSSPNIEINLKRLAATLRMLQDGREGAGNYEMGHGILDFIPKGASNCPVNQSPPNPNCYNIPAEYYIAALARIRDSFATEPNWNTDPNSNYQRWNRLVYLARFVNTWLQIVRDRTYGFREYLPGDPVFSDGSSNRTMNHDRDQNNRRLSYRFRTAKTHPADPYGPPLPPDPRNFNPNDLLSDLLNPRVDLPCDLSLADINYFGYQVGNNPTDRNNALVEREMIALARLCPTQPKYPSLYYLFPGDLNSDGQVGAGDQHGHDGTSGINMRNSDDPSPYNQPSGSPTNRNERFSEPYVLGQYIAEDANRLVTYEPFPASDLEAMRLAARAGSDYNPRDWQLPVTQELPAGGGSLPRDANVNTADLYQKETDLIISRFQPSNARLLLSAYRTGLAEKALFNGRELQTARVMDFDIDLLRRVDRGPRGANDAWLSVSSGIVYAFREDAMREDAIARPANSTWDSYLAEWRNQYLDGPSLPFRMNYDPRRPSDPPLAPSGLSIKPVDYYADPSRRVHGFRLMNGNDVSRIGGNLPPDQNIYGLTFVSDNPVYVMTQWARGRSGFNLHMNAAGNPMEEFLQALPFPYDFNQFYGRSDRNYAFATPGGDTWRPVEILADAVSLVTHNFCDGYIEHGIRNVQDIDGQFGNECTSGSPSFRNTFPIISPDLANNPGSVPRNGWAREFPYDLGSPIIVGSDGTHRLQQTGATQAIVGVDNYMDAATRFGRRYDFVPLRGTDYTVNAVIISGLVPSRRGQPYGGLHNFPRFLEVQQTPLRIQGSLLQLNFSNYATGPFDFDALERDRVGDTVNTYFPYYEPPLRFWGYDPALQYAPAGPASKRFLMLSNARNEYFLELGAQDPYICRLRQFVTPNLTCP